MRKIAFDLGPRGIRVNGVAPGATRTDALKSVLDDEIEKKIDNAGATMMTCPEALMKPERSLLDLLSGGERYSIYDTGALVLTTSNGETITARRRYPDTRTARETRLKRTEDEQ